MLPTNLKGLLLFFATAKPDGLYHSDDHNICLNYPVQMFSDSSITITDQLYPSHRMVLHTPQEDAVMLTYDTSDPKGTLLITTWRHPDSNSMGLHAHAEIVRQELLKFL